MQRALAETGEDLRHVRRRYPVAGSRQPDQLGAVAEEFRRTAFVIGDMALLMGDHRPPGPCDAGERQRIGRRAAGHQEDGDLALEDVGKQRLDAAGPCVGAVGGGRAVIGGGDRRHHWRARAGRVVADEVHEAETIVIGRAGAA